MSAGGAVAKRAHPWWHGLRDDIDALVKARHGNPFGVLGMHEALDRSVTVRVFTPEAERVAVIESETGEVAGELERLHPEGFFAGVVGEAGPFAYRLRLTHGEHSWEIEDPYRFPRLLGEVDSHLMAEGTHQRLYETLGAHPRTVDGVDGVAFAVWAPNAQRVSVVGPFNGWDGRRHPMRKRHEAGVWEIFLPGIGAGERYKYELIGVHGELLPLKADPFSFAQEAAPATGSIVHGLHDEAWSDQEWMAERGARQGRTAPISIYEVHLGSWRRGEGNAFLDYDRLAEELVPYVQDMGFTHVELLPISEHPFSGSWGYQPIGLFAPTSRFGSPEAFARMVERFHQAGIGVMIDWVPAHFPSDMHGLVRFDGTALYEHEDPRLGFHRDWNTLIYNFGRREVRNFLETNALYWLDRFHVDGLRVDAVASMLYLDYSREPGEWVPNVHGGRENLEAIAFLRSMNERVAANRPGAITVAEESTAWPQVSRPVETGGLGFNFKWNMGWMHDTLNYMAHEPLFRRYHHDQLTFGLHYAFSEDFVLPLSHDEVVHGKGSLIGKMPGDRWQKFANLRAYFGFMWAHPGKKLLFMGGEFAQEREWNHDQSLDWHLLAHDDHRGVQNLIKDLNRAYRALPSLHQRDCTPEGFQWVDGADIDHSVISFLRFGEDGAPPALVVCNFTPVVRENYRVGVPHGGWWTERVNTDSTHYGGSGVGNGGGVEASGTAWHGRPFSVELTLPPLATLIFEGASN